MKKLLSLTLFAAFLTGCATISVSPNQIVNINTSSGDSVIADINGQKIKIPASVAISRSKDTLIKISSMDNPNYESTELVIVGKQNVTKWFWGNIITGGTVGSAIDAITGSMWWYSNPNFVVPVKKAGK